MLRSFFAKASSYFASKFKFLAFVETNEQRAKIFPRAFRFGVFADNKFLPPGAARLRRWSRRLEKAEANGGKICLPNDSEEWMASIHCLAVEFDDVSVRVDDVNLRVARDGLATKLHLSEVVVGKIVAETFSAEPR